MDLVFGWQFSLYCRAAYFRLGCIAKEKGDFETASEYFTKVEREQPDRAADSWAMRANLHLQKQEWAPAQKLIDKIMQLVRGLF